MDQNDFVRLELELALRHQKRILPILIGPQTQFPRQDDLPPSLATFPLLNALRFPATLSQREGNQLVSLILAPSPPQTAQSQMATPNTPLSPQSVTPIIPTPPSEFIFTYGQYRIVIPARIYNRYQNTWGSPIVMDIFAGVNTLFILIVLQMIDYDPIISFMLGFVPLMFVIIMISYVLSFQKYLNQLLKIAQMNPYGDERVLVRSQMRELSFQHRSKIFAWYQEYYNNQSQKSRF